MSKMIVDARRRFAGEDEKVCTICEKRKVHPSFARRALCERCAKENPVQDIPAGATVKLTQELLAELFLTREAILPRGATYRCLHNDNDENGTVVLVTDKGETFTAPLAILKQV